MNKRSLLCLIFLVFCGVAPVGIQAVETGANVGVVDYDALKGKTKQLLLEGDAEGAIGVMRDALSKSPDDLRILNFLGLTYVIAEQYENGIPCLMDSISVDPVNTLNALFAAAGKVEDRKKIYVTLIPSLMNHRTNNSELVMMLIFIGVDLNIKSPLFFQSVIEGCPMDSLVENPDIRDAFQKYPHYFFDEDDITKIAEKYGLKIEGSEMNASTRNSKN